MVPSSLTSFVPEFCQPLSFDRMESLGDGELLDGFLERRDELAFEVLLRRHGPMVLGVCRRILGNVPDVDDAFQATFIVLIKKGDSVQPRHQLGAWLHGVARRVACKAKGLVARQHQLEQPLIDREGDSLPSFEQRDWLPLLDRELDRLPDKYRSVVILCDLQGNSRREAAMKLRLSEGTLSSRLARARAILGNRLKQRGVAVSAMFLAFSQSASAATPPALVSATCQTATAAVLGTSLATKLTALSQGVLQAMMIQKLVTYIGTFLVVVSLSMGAGTGYFLHQAYAEKPAKAAEAAEKPNGEKVKKPAVEGDVVFGQVKSVDATKKTMVLKMKEPGTKTLKEETLALDKDVAITLEHGAKKESKPGKLEEVAAGAFVTVRLTADKKAVAAISVRGSNLNVTVKSVDATKKTITYAAKEEKQIVEKTIQLADDATIILDDGVKTKGEPSPVAEAKLTDLKEGMNVSIQFSGYDPTKAVSVRAQGQTIGGTVKAVDVVKNTITISTKAEEQTLQISKDTKIMKAGEGKTSTEIKLADVKAGSNASVRLSVKDNSVIGIYVKE
ncbi:MAG: RNA polymerase sigma factor [Planctomycetes bacterium]|nr:RNA polymerase sigma factor [Planctomycetota bacterium]